MNGSGQVRFSELFADTVEVFGVNQAWVYYVKQHKMAQWEFAFWFKSWAGREFEGAEYYC